MVLGEALKSARLRLGMTQSEVCSKANITQGFYSSIENCISIPSFEVLQKISEALELPLIYLVWRASERKDMPKRCRHAYDKVKEVLDNYMEEIIN